MGGKKGVEPASISTLVVAIMISNTSGSRVHKFDFAPRVGCSATNSVLIGHSTSLCKWFTLKSKIDKFRFF